jgi:hypothetical protein
MRLIQSFDYRFPHQFYRLIAFLALRGKDEFVRIPEDFVALMPFAGRADFPGSDDEIRDPRKTHQQNHQLNEKQFFFRIGSNPIGGSNHQEKRAEVSKNGRRKNMFKLLHPGKFVPLARAIVKNGRAVLATAAARTQWKWAQRGFVLSAASLTAVFIEANIEHAGTPSMFSTPRFKVS